MRLGLFLNAQHPPDVRPADAVRDCLEQVRLARDLGLSAVMAGQHFLSEPFWMLQPVPFLGRISGEAGDMQVGTGVVLLPLLNPVEVAEQFATLAVLCEGRFVAGVGIGYRDVENAAFGVDRGRGRLFECKLDVVRRLLAGEAVTAEGPGFRIEGARLGLRPETVPPIWIAANGDRAVERAGRLGASWMVNPHTRLDELERQVGLFRSARAAAGHPPLEGLPVIKEICVAESDERAMRVARPYLEAKYSAYVAWGQSDVLPSGDTLRRQWEELTAGGRFVIGSPGTVAEMLREHERRLGADLVLCRVQWPGMPQEDALRSLTLLGEQVLPALGR